MRFLPVMNSIPASQPIPGKTPHAPRESFSNIFSAELRALSQAPSGGNSGTAVRSSAAMAPGIVQLPIQAPPAPAAPDQGRVTKKSGSIDIASIVNFKTAGCMVTPTSGTPKVIGDNPSVVVSGRSQAQPQAGEWDRYKMDSSSGGRKGNSSFLAGGVMVSFRVAIG